MRAQAEAGGVFGSTSGSNALLQNVELDLIRVKNASVNPDLPTELRAFLGSLEKALEELQVLLLKLRLGKTGWVMRWAWRNAEIRKLVSHLDLLRQQGASILRGPSEKPASESSDGPSRFPDVCITPPGTSRDEPILVFPAALPEHPDINIALEEYRRHRVPAIPTSNTGGGRQGEQPTTPSHEGETEETDGQAGADEAEGARGSLDDAEETGPLGDLSPHPSLNAGSVSSEKLGRFLESWLATAISTPIWVHGLYFSLGLLAIITCGMSLPLPSGEEAVFPVKVAATIDPGFYSLISQSALGVLGTFTIIVPLARRDRKLYREIPVSSPPSFRLFVVVAVACAAASGILAAWSQKLATVVGFVSTAGQLVATLMLIQGTTDKMTDRNRRIEELEVERMGWQRLWQASDAARRRVARPSVSHVRV